MHVVAVKILCNSAFCAADVALAVDLWLVASPRSTQWQSQITHGITTKSQETPFGALRGVTWKPLPVLVDLSQYSAGS